MVKWADYLISAASYDAQRHITQVRQHTETQQGIDDGTLIDRSTILTNLKHGKSYMTIYQSKSTWLKGQSVLANNVYGTPYIRVDKNKVETDNLGIVVELECQEILHTNPQLPSKN